MRRSSSSSQKKQEQTRRLKERSSLAQYDPLPRNVELGKFSGARPVKQNEGVNYRMHLSHEQAMRSSLDFYSKSRSNVEHESFAQGFLNSQTNFRNETLKKQHQLKDSSANRLAIPNIATSKGNQRPNIMDSGLTILYSQPTHTNSPKNTRALRTSFADTNTPTYFPKVDDKHTKAHSSAKNLNISSKQFNRQMFGSSKTAQPSNSHYPVVSNPYKHDLDITHGSTVTSNESKFTEASTSIDKQRGSNNFYGNFSQSSKANYQPQTSSAPNPHSNLQIYSGMLNKNIALSPARSSSFLFNGREASYAVNTTNGLVRGYNEDRVSIVINIKRKAGWTQPRWPHCSYFSIFDGHGGSLCADFLKDNLHRFILESSSFPEEPARAIEEGCQKAEHEFCKFALKQTNIDKSGSCALVVLIIDDRIYFGNVGDCRAISSESSGKSFHSLTKDHKPEELSEQERIVRNGGQVSKNNFLQNYKFLGSVLGGKLNELPFRVYPGGLSVSRSFGDIMAKDIQFGGNPNVLIAKPEISSYRIDRRHDFIFLGCELKRRRSV